MHEVNRPRIWQHVFGSMCCQNAATSSCSRRTKYTVSNRRYLTIGASQVAQSAATAPEKLDYLFPPPADIMFQGNFDALRKKAEEEEKYCLVNIQKRQEFASQMLNRDTWPDENVRAMMGFRFVFWQQEYESQAGSQYLSCYPANSLPIVDIIDPITGGLLERIEEYQTPDQMVERLTRFIDSHQWGKMGVFPYIAFRFSPRHVLC